MNDSTTRPYRQTARAKAAEDTARRILEAFIARLESAWFEEIRLDDVASDAGVTVQTVIRRFGGKDGLLEAAIHRLDADILHGRQLPVGDVARAVDLIIAEYENRGELVLRLLSQEDRHPAIRALTDHGRRTHRQWVGEVFAPWLDRLADEARCEMHDRLVIALDLYIWKLVRVDMRRGKDSLRRMMLDLCADALRLATAEIADGGNILSETIDE